MSTQRLSAWPRVLRSAVILLIAIVGSGALCLPYYMDGRDLDEALDVASIQRNHLLDLEWELQEFDANTRSSLQDFLSRCDRLVPHSDPTPRLYETVSEAASTTDVEVLSCLINNASPGHVLRHQGKTPERFVTLSMDISACCDAARVGPFVEAIQSSEVLIVPTEIALQRADERFPKVLVHVVAHAYRDASHSKKRSGRN